jgi:predicted nucleic acid-binding protein
VSVVVDASVAVEYLLKTEVGRGVAPMLDGAALYAPELLDAEVLAVLRREALSGRLSVARAGEAIEDLRDWPLVRLAHRGLLEDAWRFRANVSAYDALYLAAALKCRGTVLTTDGPLSRAPSLGVIVQNVRS